MALPPPSPSSRGRAPLAGRVPLALWAPAACLPKMLRWWGPFTATLFSWD